MERASKLATTEAVTAELSIVRGEYILQKSAVKRRTGNNDLTRRMIHKLNDQDVWHASPLSKEDAYIAAGLLYRLNDLMDASPNNEVFGGLYQAVQNERVLSAGINERRTVMSLEQATSWLLDEKNLEFFRSSKDPLLKRVSDGVEAYNLTLMMSMSEDSQQERNITIDTLLELEDIRMQAKDLDIRGFPPNDRGKQALLDDAFEFATDPRRRGQAPEYEEERLIALMELGDTFLGQKYEVGLFRLLPGSLKQKFPYYALVIELDGKRTIVAENPIKPNATIVYDELNPEAATWEELVQLDKDAVVKDFGGRAMYHTSDRSIEYHMQRVEHEVRKRLVQRNMVVAA
jgi:hypothetical protein